MDEEEYRKILSSDPRDIPALNGLGLIFQHDKRWHEALEYFERALDIDPKNKFSRNNCADCYIKIGEYGKALDYFKMVLADEQNNVFALVGKGKALNNLDLYEEALTVLNEATGHEPENYFAWGVKAIVSLNLDNYKEAFEFISKSEKISEDNIFDNAKVAIRYRKHLHQRILGIKFGSILAIFVCIIFSLHFQLNPLTFIAINGFLAFFAIAINILFDPRITRWENYEKDLFIKNLRRIGIPFPLIIV